MITINGELYHHGVKGMKWGVRRYQNYDGTKIGSTQGGARRKYQSTGIRAAIARAKNRKVNKSFEKWKKNAALRENAINIGKDYNDKRIAYERDKSNAENKAAYKASKKEYKKAVRANTTYRKGQVKGDVGHDLARKYLTEANSISKQISKDPSNKDLQKRYNKLMSQHDIELARARRAPEKYANRSRKIASIKRMGTMTIKAAAATAAIAVGTAAVNKYVLKDKGIQITNLPTEAVKKGAKMVKGALKYF